MKRSIGSERDKMRLAYPFIHYNNIYLERLNYRIYDLLYFTILSVPNVTFPVALYTFSPNM